MYFLSDRHDTWYTRAVSDNQNCKYLVEFFIKKDEFLWHAVHPYPTITRSVIIEGSRVRIGESIERVLNPCYFVSPEPLCKYCISLR